MAGRSGGTPIRTRKVTPGPDQAFTLPKGTSAAPIKQVSTYGIKNKPFPKPTKKTPKMSTTEKVTIGAVAGLAASELGLVDKTAKGVDKIIHKTKKILKKPKSDLGSDQTRRGYPHE